MKKKIPLKNVVKLALEYCGDDEEKLNFMFDFLSYLIEKKIEEESSTERDFTLTQQKKIELKIDDIVSQFIRKAEKLGYSASGMLVEMITKFFGIKYNVKKRKPREKKMSNKTVSLKIPMSIYDQIEGKIDEPISGFVRKLMKTYLEYPQKFFEKGSEAKG